METTFKAARASGGYLVHLIRPGAGENAHDAPALCGFRPSSPRGYHFRRGRWIDAGGGRTVCSRCRERADSKARAS